MVVISTNPDDVDQYSITARVYLKDYPTVYAEKNFMVEVAVDCVNDEIVIDQEHKVFKEYNLYDTKK